MDAELKTMLKALIDGQVMLAEGQARHEEQIRLVHERMDREFKLVHERMDQFDERMEGYTEAVLRGFTDAAHRHGDLDERMTAAERRLQRLERHTDLEE